MPISIRWENDQKTIILHELSGDVTAEDFLQLTEVSREMLDSVPHMVHFIYDRTAATSVPAQMSKIFQYAGKHVTPNMGMMVIVGGQLITRINLQLLKVVAPALAKEVHFADSRADARQIIAAHQDNQARA